MENQQEKIKDLISASAEVKRLMMADKTLLEAMEQMTSIVVHCFRNGGKVLICGNGGSAADAQHIAAELSGRFYHDRAPLHAEALHVNTSYLTAVANDYSYDEVYSRLVEAKGKKGDVLIAISTSGKSQNIINALETARSQEMINVGWTGKNGGQMAGHCDLLLAVPSADTPRIQECHILAGHILCQLTEEILFDKG